MKDSKKIYEVVVVLNPKAESKDKEKTIKAIEDKISGMDFSIDSRDNLGNKDLAYEIKGQNKGDFWTYNISGKNPIKSSGFSLFLNRDLSVIRYIILKK